MMYTLVNRNGIVRRESTNIQEINAIAGKHDTIKDSEGNVLQNPAAPLPKQSSHLTTVAPKFKLLILADLILIDDIIGNDEESAQITLDNLNKFFTERA